MSEYLAAFQALLDGGQADFQGQTLRCRATLIRPDVPAPPLLLAALGPRMLELAGRTTAGVSLWLVGPRTLRAHVVPRLRAAAAAAGRPLPRVVVGLPVCVTDDLEGARARVGRAFGATARFDSYRAVLGREGVEGPADVAVLGDEAAVRERLAALADAGASEFIAMELGRAGEEAQRTRELLRKLANAGA
jgi:alkanesulfonate monooxygenase SsuD/methylene tetrahydromethanopterin reductase-like flavin-dependent oxidoreductase (luciferase family)